jgi:DNA-binding NarL/FixJ family response regulator
MGLKAAFPARDKFMVTALLVEDNDFFRRSFKKILNDRFPHLKIIESGTCREALRICPECLPDLVFADINLPDGNGLDLSRTLRQQYPRVTILILTSYDLPEYRQAASANGVNYFFPKDSSHELILSMVESELSNRIPGSKPLPIR